MNSMWTHSTLFILFSNVKIYMTNLMNVQLLLLHTYTHTHIYSIMPNKYYYTHPFNSLKEGKYIFEIIFKFTAHLKSSQQTPSQVFLTIKKKKITQQLLSQLLSDFNELISSTTKKKKEEKKILWGENHSDTPGENRTSSTICLHVLHAPIIARRTGWTQRS